MVVGHWLHLLSKDFDCNRILNKPCVMMPISSVQALKISDLFHFITYAHEILSESVHISISVANQFVTCSYTIVSRW